MQREVLFRGKRTSDKVWIEGFYDMDASNGKEYIHVQHYAPPTWNDPGGECFSEYFEVMPETVGQFVCKHDKLNVFHGDIIRSINHYEGKKPYYVYHEIIWSEKHYCYLAKSVGNDNDEIGNGTVLLWVYFRNANDPTVSGNIHDNGRR